MEQNQPQNLPPAVLTPALEKAGFTLKDVQETPELRGTLTGIASPLCSSGFDMNSRRGLCYQIKEHGGKFLIPVEKATPLEEEEEIRVVECDKFVGGKTLNAFEAAMVIEADYQKEENPVFQGPRFMFLADNGQPYEAEMTWSEEKGFEVVAPKRAQDEGQPVSLRDGQTHGRINRPAGTVEAVEVRYAGTTEQQERLRVEQEGERAALAREPVTVGVGTVRALQAEDAGILEMIGVAGVEAASEPEEKVLTPEESLDMNVDEALRLAAESGEDVYIVRCPLYANSYHEYDFGRVHVTGRKAEFATMFDKKDWMTEDDWKVVGVVDPAGGVFLNEIPDILRRAFQEKQPLRTFHVTDGSAQEVVEASDRRMAAARFAQGYTDLEGIEPDRHWTVSVDEPGNDAPTVEFEMSLSGRGVQITKISQVGMGEKFIGIESDTKRETVAPARAGSRR